MGDIKDRMIEELNADAMYAEALKLLSEADQAVVRSALERYLADIADKFLEPLAARASDEEFKKALARELEKPGGSHRYDGTGGDDR